MDIITTNPKTGKPQHWEVRIKDFSNLRITEFIGVYSDDPTEIPNHYKIVDAFKKIDNATFNSLVLHPLTEEGAKTPDHERYNYHYRGEGKYIGGGNNKIPDDNAFEIRKVKIDGMVKAGCYHALHIGEKGVSFSTYSSLKDLTTGQRNTLKEWFEQQIVDAVTDEVLNTVKTEYKKLLIDHIKKDIPKIRAWLDLLEKLEA